MAANEPYLVQVTPIERALADPADPPIQAMLCGTLQRMARAEARLLEHPGVVVSGHPSECSGAPSIAVSSRWVGSNTSEPQHQLTLHRTEYPARDLCILDILPAGCSKGAALLTLAARPRHRPRRNPRHRRQLERRLHARRPPAAPSSCSTLPKTSKPSPSPAAGSIAPSNRDDGVAHAIESILRVSELSF